ncbi:MAG TPA: glycosyltransferase family 2 protein [Thermoplasmata archaeon]|nr:glycosyltransferase family 2 protein [Thermoplasmata archaeon]
MTPPLVIFQLTAIGKNPKALDESVRSVLYWVRHTPRLPFRYLVWAVIEPDGYRTSPETYHALRRDGVNVMVVPRDFETSLGARGKARALEYAAERRAELGLSQSSVWIYHQDEETSVGQDTLLGISEFVVQDRYTAGTGVILYPLDWAGTPSHIQEMTRTYDDFRVLDSMTLPGNPTTGFHGSHFIVRADIEDSVGWDSPGYTPAEDLLFEIRVRSRYGSIFGVLKGFAYEKGAFSLKDQIQQRRRWVHGVLHALNPTTELPLKRRLTIFYSALSWFSALPSVAILAASFALHYGRILEVTGIFTGFIWVSMVLAYVEGYRIHGAYLRQRIAVPRFVLYGVVGALVDVVAPWFALFTRPSVADFIPKDRPAGTPSTGAPVAGSRA